MRIKNFLSDVNEFCDWLMHVRVQDVKSPLEEIDELIEEMQCTVDGLRLLRRDMEEASAFEGDQ